MNAINTLGFTWDSRVVPTNFPVHSQARVLFRFQKMLPEFVWDASVLEGNPFTFPEVKTLLDGVTVGGRKVSDHEQVLNLAASSKALLAMVREGRFSMIKSVFLELHALVARNEALEWGVFRGEGPEKNYSPYVSLGAFEPYYPLPTRDGAPRLNAVFEAGTRDLACACDNPAERGMLFFLFGALQQFFFDGNKRTSRFMMNGVLMSNGLDAISVPAARAEEFNTKMVGFYRHRDATEMLQFLVSCHPDADSLRQAERAREGRIAEDDVGTESPDPGLAPGI